MKLTNHKLAKILQQRPDGDTIKAVARHLVESGNTRQIDSIMRELSFQLEQDGDLFLKVRSARELSQKSLDKIAAKFKKSGYKSVEIEHSIDPSLLGGIVIETPNGEMDLSIASKIAKLKQV